MLAARDPPGSAVRRMDPGKIVLSVSAHANKARSKAAHFCLFESWAKRGARWPQEGCWDWSLLAQNARAMSRPRTEALVLEPRTQLERWSKPRGRGETPTSESRGGSE